MDIEWKRFTVHTLGIHRSRRQGINKKIEDLNNTSHELYLTDI